MSNVSGFGYAALNKIDRGLIATAVKGDKVLESASGALNTLRNFDETLIPESIRGKVTSFANAHPKIAKGVGITLMVLGALTLAGAAVAAVMLGGHGVIGVAVITSVNAGGFAMAAVGVIIHRAAKRAKVPTKLEVYGEISKLPKGKYTRQYRDDQGKVQTGIFNSK